MRTGIVLGAGGGALAKMLTPFRLGAGGPLGNGRQWMPWIHVADLARLYTHASETSLINGPMNAVAPNPVRNSEFTKALAAQLKRPAFMPAPYIGLRLVFGEFAKVLFASKRFCHKSHLKQDLPINSRSLKRLWKTFYQFEVSESALLSIRLTS